MWKSVSSHHASGLDTMPGRRGHARAYTSGNARAPRRDRRSGCDRRRTTGVANALCTRSTCTAMRQRRDAVAEAAVDAALGRGEDRERLAVCDGVVAQRRHHASQHAATPVRRHHRDPAHAGGGHDRAARHRQLERVVASGTDDLVADEGGAGAVELRTPESERGVGSERRLPERDRCRHGRTRRTRLGDGPVFDVHHRSLTVPPDPYRRIALSPRPERRRAGRRSPVQPGGRRLTSRAPACRARRCRRACSTSGPSERSSGTPDGGRGQQPSRRAEVGEPREQQHQREQEQAPRSLPYGNNTASTPPTTHTSWKRVSNRANARPRAASGASRCTRLSNTRRPHAAPAAIENAAIHNETRPADRAREHEQHRGHEDRRRRGSTPRGSACGGAARARPRRRCRSRSW